MSVSRLGLLGDIHAEDRRLEGALAFYGDVGVDRVLAVGDIVDGPGDPLRCIELLEAHDVLCVAGNHDRWYLEAREREGLDPVGEPVSRYIDSLPATRTLETVIGRALLCHGLDDNDMNRLLPEDEGYALASNDELQALVTAARYALVLGGHTHRRMVRRFASMCIVNAGTLLGGHEPCLCLLDLAVGHVDFHPVDETGAVGTAVRHPLP